MVDILGFIGFDSITASMPTIKISNWTIKINKEREVVFSKDRKLIDDFKQTIKWTQEKIASFFQTTNPDAMDIAEFDSFISLNGNHSSQVVKNAIEGGAFRSVNKIKDPDKVVIELAKGGYRSAIEEVLTNLRKYQNSIATCYVITPFGMLKNLNLIGLEYSFSSDNGSNLLLAKLTFQEIRYGNVQNSNKKTKVPGTAKKQDMGRKSPIGIKEG